MIRSIEVSLRRFAVVAPLLWCGLQSSLVAREVAAREWKKHVLATGAGCATAVAGDFTGDGKPDVIANLGGQTRLFAAPDWKESVLDRENPMGLIHSEAIDADGDGDLDFVGARYTPGLIFWLEQPEAPLTQGWKHHLIDDQVNGIHGLLVGDVNGDGKPDLLANSAQPTEPFPDSLVWYERPENPQEAASWPRHVLANRDAPGLTHYLGLGDVDRDGRADVCTAAKGGPQDTSGMGNWFAWWQAPHDRSKPWTKNVIAEGHLGATNIHPADVNGDAFTDFVATRGHDRGVFWFQGPTWTAHEIHPTLFGPHCLAVTDLDGDGDTDVATVGKDDRTVAVFINDGRGVFTTETLDRDQAAYDLRTIDMDLDGDVDLVVAGEKSENVVWYERLK
jgi:hypothetical protein